MFALHVEGLHSCPQEDNGCRSATIWQASLSCAFSGSCACTHVTCASQLKKSSVSDFQTSSVQVSSQPQNDARGGVGGTLPSQVNGLHAPHSAGYSISATRAQASFWVGYSCDSIVCKYSIRSPHVYPCASVSHAPLSHETQEHRSVDIISLRSVGGSTSGVVASSCISDGLGAIAGTGSGVGTVTGTDMGIVGADTGGSLDHENAKTEFKKADMFSLTSGGNIERWR